MPECCTPGRAHHAVLTLAPPLPPARPSRIARQLLALPGGRFLMGTDDPEGFPADAEGPVREVAVEPFRIAATTVTNAQFATFVKSTGCTTEAERFGFSFTFGAFLADEVAAPVAAVPLRKRPFRSDPKRPLACGCGVRTR